MGNRGQGLKYLVLINMPVGPPKTVEHFTGQKKLKPIFYLPEKSSQILSPMSGMLEFLCLKYNHLVIIDYIICT